MFDDNPSSFFRCIRQVQQPEGLLGQLDGSCRTRQPPKLLHCHHGGLVAAEEGRTEEEKHGTKEMKHTFASSSWHPASCRPFLVILDNWVSNKGTCKNVWPFPFIWIFVLEAASFPNADYFRVPDTCNPDSCNQ
jgi:hypothetical protein